jgi:hypothetical protein
MSRAWVERAAGAALLFAWTAFSWAALKVDLHERLLPRALGALAAAVALGLLVPRAGALFRKAVVALPAWAFVAIAAAVSGAITAWLWRGAMHGQVVSGDACIYILQGRALGHLDLAIPVAPPRLASSVKFLVEGRDGRFHTVFVPGYPLFLAPFVRLGVPWLSGMVVGAAIAVAQYLLSRAVTRDEFAARLSLLLVMPTFARAIETSDLLSHAFVGTLSAFAVVLALGLRGSPTWRRAALLGACVGWVFSARMLDGFVLAAVVTTALAGEVVARRFPWRLIGVGVLAGLPFIAMVGVQQYEATGDFRKAAVLEYANRSDHPRGCLRLGFGKAIGCLLEHPGERRSFGADGYTPDDAFRIVSERTGLFGQENFFGAWVAVLAFLGLVVFPSTEALLAALYAVALTTAYGLFYYGNGIVHGARHVFPAMPFVAAMLARAMSEASRAAAGRWSREQWQGALALGYFALGAVFFPGMWREGKRKLHRVQDPRIAIRPLMARERITRGIVLIPDVHSYLEALDPWTDGDERVLVYSDNAGEADLRRYHPELPVFLVVDERTVLRVGSSAPGPGLRLEMERAWPSLQRPIGLSAGIIHTLECCLIPTSGQRALRVFAVEPGGRLGVPFDLAYPGRYRFRMNGVAGVDQGRFLLSVDHRAVGVWDGYAPRPGPRQGEWSEARDMTAGRHWLVARSLPRTPPSTGDDAMFDLFEAEPVSE